MKKKVKLMTTLTAILTLISMGIQVQPVCAFNPTNIVITPNPVIIPCNGSITVTVVITGTISLADQQQQYFNVRLVDEDYIADDILGEKKVEPKTNDVFVARQERTFTLEFTLTCKDSKVVGSGEKEADLAVEIDQGRNTNKENHYDTATGECVPAKCATIVAGDPPLYQDIIAFPTPERFLGADLNSNGNTNDTILRYWNLKTNELINTGLIASDAHHTMDIYENTIAFVGEGSHIYYYDINTGTVVDMGVPGFHPSISSNIIAFASEGTIHYFDLNMQKLVDTKVKGENPAIYQNTVVFHANAQSTIWVYDVCNGTAVDTGIIGMNATIYESVIAFETPEALLLKDLNNDGDINDWVIRYFDLETQTLTNTGVIGIFPTLYGSRIAFTTPEEDINKDLNGDGRILGSVIHYYDLETNNVVNTQNLGTEPDIYKDIISFYVWENWTAMDLNGDGDQSDTILRTYQLSALETTKVGLETVILVVILLIGGITIYFMRRK